MKIGMTHINCIMRNRIIPFCMMLLISLSSHAQDAGFLPLLGQDKAYIMHYDSPASNYLADDPRRKAQPIGYIQEALPLGNGRLGAMFSGGINNEHLVVNEISAWMNTVRARDEVDIDWKNGKLKQATIRAIKGGEFRIYSNDSLSKVISLKKGESIAWKDN